MNIRSPHAKKFAQMLLDLGAVALNPREPFRYASGKMGPIYCDNRLLLTKFDLLQQCSIWLAELIQQNVGKVEAIMGVATAGIPHAVLCAQRLRLPCGYVRTQAKEHGKKNLIEGHHQENSHVVLIEDLLNSGVSSFAALENLHSNKLKVGAMVCLVNYQFPLAQEMFLNRGVPIYSLCGFDDLLQVGVELNKIKADDRSILESWHQRPDNWTPSFNLV